MGKINTLLVDATEAEELLAQSSNLLSWHLTERQACDIELLLNGGFTPLTGFLNSEDYASVCNSMRLKSGALWSIPIILDVTKDFSSKIKIGDQIALRDEEGNLIAIQDVEDIYQPDLRSELDNIYKTKDLNHPGVNFLIKYTNPIYVGGPIKGLALPKHYDFQELRKTPTQLRDFFYRNDWSRIVAFQTRNPMHRAHVEMTLQAIRKLDCKVLLHPVVGLTKSDDIDHYTRVRCYKAILQEYPEKTVELALLPLAMRMAGPREALWHALIRKNYGCTHFIIGRDHAGPGLDLQSRSYYGSYEAQELVEQYKKEIEIEIVPFKDMVYLEDEDRYVSEDEIEGKRKALRISGTEFRKLLQSDQNIPNWFSYPKVTEILKSRAYSKKKGGFVVFFTGLSASGKSSIANLLMAKLLEDGSRNVTLLDGDKIRKLLSSDLGFTKEDRDLNVRRIGYVASQISMNGGVAICAQIAPYDSVRKEVRDMVSVHAGFILVHLSTPINVCELRDRKGLYAKARAGIINSFTGISDTYEIPDDADITLDTSKMSLDEECEEILRYLENKGYL